MALGKNLTKHKPNDNPPVSALESKDKEDDNPSPQAEVAETILNPEVEEAKSVVTYQQFCVFKSGGEEYAIPINLVREVVPYPEVAPVPQMPPYVRGMSNVRGNIYGVLDLNLFFKTKSDTENLQKKFFLVLDHDVFQMGIAIPEVPNTLLVSEEMIEKLSSSRLKSTIGQKYLKGIIKKDRRMIILFDILGMISSDKFTIKG